MQMQQFTYPFDPNGTAPSNKVVGERHTITPVNGPDFRFLIPKAAPYFRNSLKVTHEASGRVLVDGIDYQPGHRYDAASNTAPFLTIFGSILIMDNTLEGTFSLEYQTLGGEHTVDEQTLLAILANTQIDPRMTKWDYVLNTPGVYDPLLHRHHAIDSVGYDDMVVALNRLFDAIIARQDQDSVVDPVARAHIANLNNPHQTRLAQLPDGAHLVGLTPAAVTYILNLFENGAGGELPHVPEQQQLEAGDFIIPANATAPVAYSLPQSPANFATVRWMEGFASFATNSVTFLKTDKPIMGLDENLVVSTPGAGGTLMYFASLGYWKVYLTNQAGASAGTPGSSVMPIDKAAITSPTNEAVGIPANLTLTCSNFTTTPVLADNLLRVDWEISADPNFVNLLWQGSTSTTTVSPSTSIPGDTRVYVRARFVGKMYGAAQWSDVVTFVVEAIAGPTSVTIAGAQLASGGITHKFVVNSTVYSGGGTHASTQVQVLNLGGTVVYDSGELPGAIVSHTPFNGGFRPDNLTDYSARVRYKLASGQWTQYTSSNLRTGSGTFTSSSTTFSTTEYSYIPYQGSTSYYAPDGNTDPFSQSGPYRICMAGDANSGELDWVCDPNAPLDSAPPAYNSSYGPVYVSPYTYPRTSHVTEKIQTLTHVSNTTRITSSWTEW